VRTRFALTKTYGVEDPQVRRISRPDAETVRVAVAGVERLTGWSVDPNGAIDFAVPPALGATVSAGFLFDVPVRFAEDQINVSIAGWRTGDLPSVPLVEIRED
jgi:uncharacterized protein (TIGR02217 family)